MLQQFPKLKKTNEMSILILENPVQDLTSSTCEMFQFYFYKDLFDPDEKSKVIDHENLNKHIIKKFKEEYNL